MHGVPYCYVEGALGGGVSFRCRRYGYVCGAGVVLGSVGVVQALLFIVYFLVPHARADGCLPGGGREICRALCVVAFVCFCTIAGGV